MKSKLKRFSSEKKAYYMGMGYAMACDLKMPSVDVKKYRGLRPRSDFEGPYAKYRIHDSDKPIIKKLTGKHKKSR